VDSLGSAKLTDSTGLTDAVTDCAKLTDARNHLMPDREGQDTTFPQTELSALASDSQETPQETPPLQTTMATMFYMPMPRPGSQGSPLFEGSNASEFFRRYEQDCKDYHVSESNRLERLLNYYTPSVARTVKSMKQ